ncbi:MAG: hypothetical protein V7782_12860 [Psychromonas sp.]
MKKILGIFLLILTTGCTTVQYNGSHTNEKQADYPEVGKTVTIHVGGHLVQKETVLKDNILVVNKQVEGVYYDIPANNYSQIGYDDEYYFFTSTGVKGAALADPIKALAIDKNNNDELCVISVFGASKCYQADFEHKAELLEISNRFHQTLVYRGREGNKINILYTEFSNNSENPSNNNVEFDLSSSTTIDCHGAVLEIIAADDTSITYKLVSNFP